MEKAKDRYHCMCLRCSHKWYSKVKDPLTCPNCRTPFWDIAKRTKEVK
jgi:Zn finger protein HypA/HybF involved in hydrogenase expression